MKKLISVLLTVALLLSVAAFSSCGKKPEDTNPVESSNSSSEDDINIASAQPEIDNSKLPKIELFADKPQAAPGEIVTVVFCMKEAKSFCCVNAALNYSADILSLEKQKGFSDGEYQDIINASEGAINYTGLVITTVDFDSRDLLTATFKVSESAQPGSTAKISLVLKELLVGLDDKGNETKEVVSSYSPLEISVTVK